MQDAEALERIACDLVEDKARDNVRYAEVRWAPLLHTARGLTGRQVVEADGARRPRGAAPAAGHRGPADRDAHALARARGATSRSCATSRRTASPTGSSRVDLAGPEAALPRPDAPPRGHRPRARDRASTSPPTPASGAARAQVRRTLAIDPERIAHGPLAIDDPGARRRAHPARDLARPVPDLERPGADRPDARGPPDPAPAARRRAGHAQHRRPHGLRHLAVRRVRAGASCRSGRRSRSCGRWTSRRSTPRSATTPRATGSARSSSPGAPGSRSSPRTEA